MNIPTEIENKKMEELFLAIYFNDVKKVIEFKKQYPDIYVKKNNFLLNDYDTFDLINLTFFNQTLWKEELWSKRIKSLVKKNKKRVEQMLDFWRSEFGRQDIKREIEYNQYWSFFYCNGYDKTYGEWKKYNLEGIKTEFREIDIMLMYQVERFDFVETRKLLEQGAKSDIDFYGDDFSSVNSRICTEFAFLATSFVVSEFEIFEKKGYNQDFDITDMFSRLLGLAAHEEMYSLLAEYE